MKEFRKEIKIVIPSSVSEYLVAKLKTISFLSRQWPSRFVHTIYFDDLNLKSAEENLAGISKRFKSRIRWYSISGLAHETPSILTLERKIKVSSLGIKDVEEKKFTIDYKNDYLSYKKITTAFHTFHKSYGAIIPSVYGTYKRDYYHLPGSSVRLTIDSEINFYNPDESDSPIPSSKYEWEKNIIELKFSPEEHSLAKIFLNIIGQRPSRNSKYLTGLSMFNKVKYF